MKKTVNELLIENKIKFENIFILIFFWSEWSEKNKILEIIINKIKKNFKKNLEIFKININYNKYISEKFSIREVPTTVVILNNHIIVKKIGFFNNNYLKKIINKYI